MIQALALLLVTSLGCAGLFAAWAATSSLHWFFRVGLFVAGLALLLLIPAYEPLVVFLLQGVVIATGVQLVRWWRRRIEGKGRSPRQARFALATLLLATVYGRNMSMAGMAFSFKFWETLPILIPGAAMALWWLHFAGNVP